MATLHMKIGSLIVEQLLNICQENILKGNIDYAMNIYPKAFGMNDEHTFMILRNEAVVVTNDDHESISLTDLENERETNANNIYDWNLIMTHKIESLKNLYKSLIDVKHDFDRFYYKNIIDYSIPDMMEKYFSKEELSHFGIYNIAAGIIGSKDCRLHNNQYDNPQNKWDMFEDKFYGYEDISESDTANWEKILFLTVRYNKLIKMIHKEYISFEKTYLFLVENKFIEKKLFIEETIENILSLLFEFADTSKGYSHPMCNTGLYDYKRNLLDDLLKTEYGKEYGRNGILKKDIMDGYDAGWLSPSGEFYGGNGDTSSMIHMNIAEQIFKGNNEYANKMNKDGVSEWGGSNSPEYWLEKNGWVKIHHNDCYGSFIGERNPEDRTPDFPYAYNPTEIQIKMICDYADKFYGGKFYTEANAMGRMFHTEPFSTYKVRQMDEFKIHETFGR